MEKFIVVTGDPRSGTSLMMQVLMKLGVEVIGDKFPKPPNNPNANPRIIAKNPGGFWEVPRVVMTGLSRYQLNSILSDKESSDYQKYFGGQSSRAIKIMAPGAFEAQLPNSIYHGLPYEYVESFIFCIRNPKYVSVSQSGLESSVQIATLEGNWIPPVWNIDPFRWISEVSPFIDWAIDQGIQDKILFIDYDSWFSDASGNIDKISTLVQSGDDKQKLDAISLIDPKLNRSPSDFSDYPREIADLGLLADSLYTAILSSDWLSAKGAGAGLNSERERRKLEGAVWYDEKHGVMSNPVLERQLQTVPGLAQNLLVGYADKIRQGLIFSTAQDYSEPSDADEYIIKRPADLGDLVRKKVSYSGHLMTREQAMLLHLSNIRQGLEIQLDDSKKQDLLSKI